MAETPRWLREWNAKSIDINRIRSVEHAKDNVIAAARAWAASPKAEADEALALAVARLEHAEGGK